MNEFGFFIKKWVSFFVEPYGMILLLFIFWYLFLKMKKKKLSTASLYLAFTLMFLFSYPPSSNFLITNLEDMQTKYDYKQEAKYIHVLGSGHNTDASQPLSSQVRATGLTRVVEGVVIYNHLKGSKLIFTGYAGKTDISNAQMHAKMAIELGVKAEDIIVGKEPKDTKEEALFSKKIVKDSSLILVTSASHMPRAVRLFSSYGLNVISASTDFQKRDDISLFMLPSIDSFENSQRAMHEYYGILWSKLRSK
ncbi:YdcF family protein [Sulfurimonas sp.]|uniref:YdcF family protein n=1 Tax=Sulfurimonas sp. TaxID=2022749 RepID=UPI002AB0428F|nr:ElyC/SanA/YdcF family protein [Sulfurimonas sp.]